jgi:hypothetical protein
MGNLLVASVIGLVTGWAGFHEKQSRDVSVLALAYIGTLLNTLFDLSILLVVAKHATLTAAFEGAEEGYPRVLATQLYELIVPGYLFIPVLAVPIFERVLPFYLGAWYVRSKPRVLLRDAKEALSHAPFDICWRYADILNNFTICSVLFFLPSGDGWRVMVAFALFCFIIYCLDRYVLLFASTVTPYAQPTLFKAFWWWWSVPTGVLAVVAAFWGVHADFFPTWWYLLGAFCLHVIVYCGILAALSGAVPVREESYVQVLLRMPGSYFSTNPVCQLRSRVLGERHGDDGSRLYIKP